MKISILGSNNLAIDIPYITKEMLFPTNIVEIKLDGEHKILWKAKAEKEFNLFLSSSIFNLFEDI